MKYEFLTHTADIKFKAYGKSIEEVFENSALALKESICGKVKIKANKKKEIKISGKDFESLLYKFLEEIIYLLEAENFVFSKIENLKIKDKKLNAEIFGDNSKDYNFTNSVKAVTYNEMSVENLQRVLHSSCNPTTGNRRSSFREKKKWIAQVVLDV